MAPSPADLYLSGLDFVTSVVDRVPDGAWDGPSPCADWRALDVLGHLGTTTRFGIELLQGRQPAWQPSPTPGAAVDGPPEQWWRDLAAQARTAGIDVEIPAEAIQFAHSVLDRVPEEQLRSPATFGPEVPVAADATPTAAFIAWTGRDPGWVATLA